MRIELLQDNRQDDEVEFSDVVATLALHVVGAHGLPYAEMLKRQEKLAYLAQLAAVSRMTALYCSLKVDAARRDRQKSLHRRPSSAFGPHEDSPGHVPATALPQYGFQQDDAMYDRDESWDEVGSATSVG